ncbi:MAG: zinc-binding dehydrogenase, partial [Salinibacter sp.]
MITAAVFDGPDNGIGLRTFAAPSFQEGAALVRVTCCTICGSDVHTFTGNRQEPTPSILGHEIVGTVAATGEGTLTDYHGRPVELGDRITWSMQVTCGDCYYCDDGIPQKCEHLFKYGHAPVQDDHVLSGGLSEACTLRPGTTIVRVPENVPDVVASPANCATATVAGAVRLAGPLEDRNVLIQGAGMLGLTATAMADAAGAASILVLEQRGPRQEWARRFGADGVVANDREGTLVEEVRRQTDGRGADVLLELTGDPDATEAGIAGLRTGGTAVLVGATYPARPLHVEAEDVVRGILTLRGLHNYTHDDLARAVSFLADCHARYPFREVVQDGFSLDGIEDAF